VEGAISVWWMALVLQGLVVFATALPAAFRGRAVLNREADASAMYARGLAAAIALVADAPWVVASATASAAIIARIVAGGALLSKDAVAAGMPNGASGFLPFWGASVLFCLACNALARALAHAAPTLPAAQSVGYLVQALLLLFGGLLVPSPALPAGWKWLMTITPLSHAANAVWAAFFFCTATAEVTCRTFVQEPVPAPIVESDFVVSYLGIASVSAAEEINALLVFVAVYSAAAVVTAHFVSYVKR